MAINVHNLTVETENGSPSLLDLAANNDIEGFKRSVGRKPPNVNEVGLWYGRQKGSKKMVVLHRTPLMIAATFGSIDVMKLIISSPDVDVNQSCGVDKTTALHCAASGGSLNAVDAVKLLLEAGADPNKADANGFRPLHVIIIPPENRDLKTSLEALLATPSKKEYPVDLSFPDITNSVYSSDEFRMYAFKIRPCSRAYSHDWTECPFVHPGENARRRDPRKYHYSCVPCTDYRKGACQKADMCSYAHGVFESWLHPAQYRTRLCKDGSACDRKVCFFAHKQEELRMLYGSTGSAVNSPRSPVSPDFAAAMNLLQGSPSIPVMMRTNSLNRSARFAPSNLEDIFSGENSFSPTQRSTVLNQLQQQGVLSPTRTSFSPRNVDSFRMEPMSPMSSRLSNLAQHEMQAEDGFVSMNSTWPYAEFAKGTPCNMHEECRSKRSPTFDLVSNGEEPDLSWVQSLVKESPQEMNEISISIPTTCTKDTGTSSSALVNMISEAELLDKSALGALLDKLRLEQLMAQ